VLQLRIVSANQRKGVSKKNRKNRNRKNRKNRAKYTTVNLKTIFDVKFQVF
jgi:hypothetical protein